MLNKRSIWLAIAALFTGLIPLGCVGTDLNYAVPSVDMYTTTAIQLSVEEVEKASNVGDCNFFIYVEKFIKIERSNPITLSGEEIEKVPPTSPNVHSFKGAKLFRSCFYNSQGYILESREGLFVSQGILFGNKKEADLFEKDSLVGFKDHYAVVLRKGNTVCVVNMWLGNVGPTKELLELVRFAEKHGFRSAVVDNRSVKN